MEELKIYNENDISNNENIINNMLNTTNIDEEKNRKFDILLDGLLSIKN